MVLFVCLFLLVFLHGVSSITLHALSGNMSKSCSRRQPWAHFVRRLGLHAGAKKSRFEICLLVAMKRDWFWLWLLSALIFLSWKKHLIGQTQLSPIEAISGRCLDGCVKCLQMNKWVLSINLVKLNKRVNPSGKSANWMWRSINVRLFTNTQPWMGRISFCWIEVLQEYLQTPAVFPSLQPCNKIFFWFACTWPVNICMFKSTELEQAVQL